MTSRVFARGIYLFSRVKFHFEKNCCEKNIYRIILYHYVILLYIYLMAPLCTDCVPHSTLLAAHRAFFIIVTLVSTRELHTMKSLQNKQIFQPSHFPEFKKMENNRRFKGSTSRDELKQILFDW